MRRLSASTVVACLLLSACTRLEPGVSGTVDLAPPGSDELRLTYLGTGGWILRRGGESILTAPLFTNPGMIRAGVWTIASDSALVDRYMSRYDVRSARAILVGHAHYDHLIDVPRVAERHAPAARIVGNRTVGYTLAAWPELEGRVDVVEDAAADVESPGRWIEYGPSIRVLPLRSHHAPHFDGMTLYQGDLERPLRRKPRTADEWLDGQTLAYLIDFVDPTGAIAFRVYYQDAVSPPPAGFAPEALIAERPVDIALLVPATFDQVDWHPEAFVENLRPDKVILGHWEDFFSPIDEPTRAILLTDLQHFERRLRRVFDGEFWRPEIFTEFRIPRR